MDALSSGNNLIDSLDWYDDVVTISYWYKSDAYGYYSPYYGPFGESGEGYLAARHVNDFGYPVYVWVKIKFEIGVGFGLKLTLMEYAIAPYY